MCLTFSSAAALTRQARKAPSLRPLVAFCWLLSIVVTLSAVVRLWGGAAQAWFADYPALMRLVGASSALVSLAAAWAALREPRSGAVVPLCLGSVAIWNVLELSLGPLLGSVLLSLVAIALIARPRPNRIVVARCFGLAGLAVAIAVAAGH